MTAWNVYSTAFSATGFDTNSTPTGISVSTNAGTLQTTSLTGLLAGSLAVLAEGNNDTWNGGNGINFTASTGTLRAPYLALMTTTDQVNSDLSFETVSGLSAGTTTFTAAPVPPQVASKQAFSVGAFAPAPSVMTLTNNIAYTSSGTLDLVTTTSDQTLGNLSLPNANTTLTISAGRSDSFNGISSAGSGGTGNAIIAGTAAPIIALAPSSAVSVNGDPLTIGPVIGDFQNNGSTAGPILTSVNKTGTGTLKLSGINTYTGGTTITGGTLSVGTITDGGIISSIGASSSAASNLVFGGGTLLYNGSTTSTNRNFTITAGKTAIIDVAANTLTMSGATGASTGGLTKTDAGTLTMNGTSLYTGPTTVSGGVLNINNANASSAFAVTGAGSTLNLGDAATLGSSSATLGAGTTLKTGINTTFTGGLTSTGATVNVTGTGVAGTLTLGNDLNTDSNTSLNLDFVNPGSVDAINIVGAHNVFAGGATINLAGSGMIIGNYTLISDPSGTLNGTFTVGSMPAGSFAYALVNVPGVGVQLQVISTDPTLVWEDVSPATNPPTPATDGGGTWSDGSTNFYNVQVGGTQVPFSNAGNLDVDFGAGGAGSTVTLGTPIRAGGNLIFTPTTTPYTLSGTVTNNLTLVGGIIASGSATVAAPTVLAPATAQESWFISTGVTVNEAGSISQAAGSVGLVKAGPGTLLVSGATSTYTGGTTVSGGTLKVGANNALPTNGGVILSAASTFDLNGKTQSVASVISSAATSNLNVDGGTLDIIGNANNSFGGVVNGTGTLIHDGFGTLNLGGTASGFVGTVNVNNGGITGVAANVFAAGTTINVASGAVLSASKANAFQGDVINVLDGGSIVANVLNGFAGATINILAADDSLSSPTPGGFGNSTIIIVPGVTYAPAAGGLLTGATVVVPGPSGTLTGAVLDIVNLTAVGDGNVGQVSLTGGIITNSGAGNGASLSATTNYDLRSGTVAATLGGAAATVGANVLATTGSVLLNTAPTYTGSTTVASGTLIVATTIPSIPGPVAVSGASAILSLGANHPISTGTLTVAAGGTVNGSGTTTVTSTGTFELQQGTVNVPLVGTGVVANKTTAGTVVLTAINTYTGATNIQAGTLQLGAVGSAFTNVLSPSSPVVLGSATTSGILDLNGLNQTLTSLTISGGTADQIINSATLVPTLTINNSATDTYAGMLGTGVAGAGNNSFNLVKTNTGVLLLSGNNTFNGTVNVNSGTLQLGSANALGTSPGSVTNIASGATLDVNGQTVDPTELINLTGTGVGNNGVLINSNTTTQGTVSQLFVSGDVTLGGAGRTNIRNSGTIVGSILSGTNAALTPGTTFNVTKVGAGEIVVGVTNDADLNNININVGKFTIESSGAIGRTSAVMTINSGATGGLFSNNTNTNVKNVVINDGGTLLGDGNAGTVDVFGDPTTTLTLMGNATISSTVPFTIASKITGTPTNLFKTGVGTLTPTNLTNDYTGTISITGGILDATSVSATGNTAGTIIANGGTIQWDGTFAFPTTKILDVLGSGQGGIGAFNHVGGNVTLSSNVTFGGSAAIGNGTAGNKLVLAGNLVLPAIANVSFAGAGNIEVVKALGNGTAAGTLVTQNSLATNWYPQTAAFTDTALGVNTASPVVNTGPNATGGMLTLTPSNVTELGMNLGNFPTAAMYAAGPPASGLSVSAGSTSQVASVVAGMLATGNKFGSAWMGTITVGGSSPIQPGVVSFGTNTDDGSAIYVDVNQNGQFEPSELVVNNGANGAGHGVVQAVGSVSLAAGIYPVYIGYYESSGGGSFEARFSASGTTGTPTPYASQVDINPLDPSQVGIWATPNETIANGLNVTGSGTVTLDTAANYNGGTTITGGGTLKVAGSNFLPSTTNVVLGNAAVANALTATGNLDLGTFSLKISGLIFNSVVNTPNNINVGGTLTVNIGPGTLLVGANISTSDVTKLTFSGGGTLNVMGFTGSPTSSLIQIGNPTTNVGNIDTATMDLTGLSTAIIAVGEIHVSDVAGNQSTTTPGGAGTDTLSLAPTTTITASTLMIGAESSWTIDNAAPNGNFILHTVNLGSVANVFNIDNIDVGAFGSLAASIRASGQLHWAPGVLTGTLTLADQFGGGNMTMNMVNTATVTGNAVNAIVDFGSHTVNGNIASLNMAARSAGSGATGGSLAGTLINPGVNTAILNFGAGTLNIANLNMTNRSGVNTGANSSTFNITGGNVSIGSLLMSQNSTTTAAATSLQSSILNISGTANVTASFISMGTPVGAAGDVVSEAININGGLLSVGSDINLGSSLSGTTNTAVIKLAGGTLEMNSHNIGNSGALVTASFTSGVLRDLQDIDNGAPLIKSGTGTLTLATPNNYTGITSVTGGILDVTSLAALGNTPSIAVSGGTVQLDGGMDISTKPLTLNGAGAGGIGALNIINGNSTVNSIVLTGSTTIGSGTAGSTLTIAGNTIMPTVADLTFTGAGKTNVVNGFGNGNATTQILNLTSSQYYSGTAAQTGTTTAIISDGLGDNLLNVQTVATGLTPFFTGPTPNIDFGAGTETVPGNGSVLDRNSDTGGTNIAQDPFHGIGVPLPPSGTIDNMTAVWIGTITIPDSAFYTFTTRSDDGSNLWIDLNNNGSFDDSGELLVGNNAAQAVTNKSSTSTSIAAGVYPIRIAYFNATGSSAMQVSWSKDTPGTSGVFPRQIIPNTSTPLNNVIMNGTGLVVLNGADTYNGTTTINAGTLEVDGTTASTAATNVVAGTLAGNGTIAGPVNVTGGTVSPGTLAGSATGILSTGALTFTPSSIPAPALVVQVNGSAVGTEYDQVNVTGGVSLGGALLNVNVGNNIGNDSGNGTPFNHVNNVTAGPVNGSFAGVLFGGTITVGGKAFQVTNTLTGGGADGNDAGLIEKATTNFFVSPTFNASSTTDPISGQPVTFGVNAFNTIQAAISAYVSSGATEIFVDPGTYGATSITVPSINIVLQGGSIEIDGLDGSSNNSTQITIPTGTILIVDGDGSSTTDLGQIVGGGTLQKSGAGTFTIDQANTSLTGPVHVAGGTLQLGNSTLAGSAGTGAITVDAGANLLVEEPGNATTFANAIGGQGNLEVFSTVANSGSVLFTGTNTFTGGLTVNGGRFVPNNLAALGSPSSFEIDNGGQFTFNTITGANITKPLVLNSSGFTINGLTSALAFTGTTNTWSGAISVTGTGLITAVGSTANLAGAITGAGQLVLGAGTTTAETYLLTSGTSNVGSATVNVGSTVILGNATASGALSNLITLNGTATNQATLAFNMSGTTSYTGTISAGAGGGGALAVQGGGTVVFGAGASISVGTNGNLNSGLMIGSNAGGTTGAGTLNILTGATVADAADFYVGNTSVGTVNQSGGSVTLTSTAGTGNNSNLIIEKGAGNTGVNNTSLNTSTYNLTGGSLTATSSEILLGNDAIGLLNISGATTVATLLGIRESSANFSAGTVNLASGTLKLGASGVYSGNVVGNQALVIAAGTLQATANNKISVPTDISGSVTFDSQTFSQTFSSNVGGSGSITKISTGTLNLAGVDTYSGGTTISNGVVASASTSSLGSGPVIEAGGTLKVIGSNSNTTAAVQSVSGFGATGAGWVLNVAGGSSPATIAGNDLTITPNTGIVIGTGGQVLTGTSAWFGQKVNAAAFTAQFTYNLTPSNFAQDGFAFVLQNAATGTAAVGGVQGNMGYSGGNVGNSFAVAFNISNLRTQGIAFSENGTAFNGAAGPFQPIGNNINLVTGPVNITVSYDGALMTVTLQQGANTYSTSYGVNLLGLLGGNTGFVGFTGGAGSPTKQDITNFTYTANTATAQVGVYPNAVNVATGATGSTAVNPTGAAPTVTMGPLTLGSGATLNVTGPSSSSVAGFGGTGTGWTANGGPTVSADVLTITSGAINQARTFFNNTPVVVNTFHTSFDYTDTAVTANTNNADGTAFILQNVGATALGTGAGGFGYTGLTPSFAVEFNIASANSVGFRFAQNGAVGGYASTGSVNLASGTPVHVDLSYNGTTLTMTLTDASNNTFTSSETVDIASILGSSTAFVGFGGSTNATQASTQTVANFAYTGSATAYGLSFGGTSLVGTGAVNVTSNGTVTLGSLNDAGVAATLNLNSAGAGTVVVPVAATSLVNGSAVNLAAGTMNLNAAGALGTLAAVSDATGATINLGANETLGSLSGSGAVNLNGQTLTVGSTNNLSSTFGGTIANGSAPGGLATAGAGSLTLTGASTYTGPTSVSVGSLIVNGSLASSSTVSIGGSGILGGSGSVGNVTNTGIVNPGSPGTPGTLTVAGNLTLGTGALVLDLSNAAADSVNATGSSVNITGATLSLNVGTITPGESFTILTVPGTSGGLTGTFVGLDGTAGHNTITAGGTTFTISYTGGDGNDITLTATGTASPSIVSTVLNGGIAYVNSTLAQHQHSMVENVVYSFSTPVSLSASNFALSGINGTTTPDVPNVVVNGSGSVWTVTFSGAAGVNNVRRTRSATANTALSSAAFRVWRRARTTSSGCSATWTAAARSIQPISRR